MQTSKKNKAYTQTTSRDTAVITLRSWLTAVGIPNKKSALRGSDITVTTKDGGTLEVLVQLGRQERPEAPAGAVVVRAEELRCARLSETHLKNRSRSPLQIAFDAFHAVTEKAGYGRPAPFDRGNEPDRMFSWEEDGFLVPLRHTEFRRAPNPSPAKYAQYKDILDRAAYMFYGQNERLCERQVTSRDDIKSFAYFCLVGFCAHYERPEPIGDENERLLTAYLKQRLAELRKSWLTKFMAQVDDVPLVVHNYGGTFDPSSARGEREEVLESVTNIDELDLSHRENRFVDADVELDGDFALDNVASDEGHRLVSEAEEEEHQNRAKVRLQKALAAMPHDQLVQTLNAVINDENQGREARKMATRQLMLHSRRCPKCS